MAGVVSNVIRDFDARMARLEETLRGHTEASDARMTRIENDLQGLIQALARQHTNGHSKH